MKGEATRQNIRKQVFKVQKIDYNLFKRLSNLYSNIITSVCKYVAWAISEFTPLVRVLYKR